MLLKVFSVISILSFTLCSGLLLSACGQPFSSAQTVHKATHASYLAVEKHSLQAVSQTTTPETAPADDKFNPLQMEGFWDQKSQQGRRWTAFTAEALEDHGQELLAIKPKDIKVFCPAFSKLGPDGVKSFWIHFISAMAFRESTFKPHLTHIEKFTDSSGKPVISRGLLQLSYESVKPYDCDIKNPQDLHDPKTNLTCSIKILNRWVSQDEYISMKSQNGKWRGGARYWGVLRTKKTLKIIRGLMHSLEFCKE